MMKKVILTMNRWKPNYLRIVLYVKAYLLYSHIQQKKYLATNSARLLRGILGLLFPHGNGRFNIVLWCGKGVVCPDCSA